MDPRALVIEIYRQKTELMHAGESPERVVMSMESYRAIQSYHATLGELPDGAVDYIGKYQIFGLEISIDNGADLRVD